MTGDLLPVEEAQRRLLESVSALEAETCPLDETLGRVLAQDVSTSIDIPPFANSAMDGFALRSEDTRKADKATSLTVIGTVQAGMSALPTVGQGQAVRIMTGAPLPPGTDAVIPFEETRESGTGVVEVPSNVPAGNAVRPAGLDVRAGESILNRGTRLGAAPIMLAAASGHSHLPVFRRPKIAVLATGDELVEVGTPLAPGQIYNSNAHGLRAAISELGAEPVILTPARDDAAALRETFRTVRDVDLIISSGGVSVGDFDYVKDVIAELGSIDFWRIRMRPGKPLMLGSVIGDDGRATRIIGLPGNPTSTMITFHVLARPLIRALMGVADPIPTAIRATSRDALDNRGGRETYFRVVLSYEDAKPTVRLAGGQDSSMVSTLARANALARVPAATESLGPGETVDVLSLSTWN